MPTTSEAQKRLMLAAAHSPRGFGGVSQKVGLDFMHADQAVGRVGRAGGGAASSFDTPLSDARVADYLNWKQRFAPNDNGSDYDLHGAYLAGIEPEPNRGHFPDTFKKPNHPTFSDESQYSTPDHSGGSWSTRAGHDVFTPSPFNLSQSAPDQLKAYFDQKEPDAMLDLSNLPGKAHGGAIADALRAANSNARLHLAAGGYSPPSPGYGEREQIRSILSPTAGGVINSEIPGRTDHIPTTVAADSYVIPADVVSGVGEGNTLAGAKAIQSFLETGPYGTKLPKAGGRDTIPRPPPAFNEKTTAVPGLARGGSTVKHAHIKNDPNEVPVIVAGGEMIVDPHVIAHHPMLGNLPVDNTSPAAYRRAVNFGHKALDKWVLVERKKTIKAMQKLKGPKK